MNIQAAHDIGAIVTVFYPEKERLNRLLSVLEMLGHVVIAKNDPKDHDAAYWAYQMKQHPNLIVHQMPDNKGIATAINTAAYMLEKRGVTGFLLFDQDSQPRQHALENLIEHFLHVKRNDSGKLAAVVPVTYDQNAKKFLPFLVQGQNSVKTIDGNLAGFKVLATIASGMLIPVQAWKKIGLMNEGFFMDHVDTEWCLRANYLKFHIDICKSSIFDHTLGDIFEKKIGCINYRYRMRNVIRTYSLIHNGWKIHKMQHAPKGWGRYMLVQSARSAVRAVFFGPERVKQLRAIILAMRDARKPG